jgi:CheY-like chemotaxis protein
LVKLLEKMKQISILIVEDNPIMANTLSKFLKYLKFSVIIIVDSGKEAINMALKMIPNLIFMDINLQGAIDGSETAEIIGRKLNTPIIFITESRDRVNFNSALDLNPIGFMFKPISMQNLKNTIKSVLI